MPSGKGDLSLWFYLMPLNIQLCGRLVFQKPEPEAASSAQRAQWVLLLSSAGAVWPLPSLHSQLRSEGHTSEESVPTAGKIPVQRLSYLPKL